MAARGTRDTGRSRLPGRREVLAGGAALGLLGTLTACGAREERERWAAKGERPVRFDSAITWPAEPTTPEDPRGLECSAAHYVLSGTGRAASLDPEQAWEMFSDEVKPESPVSAPEGEEFLAFTLEVDMSNWVLMAPVVPPEARLVVRRPDGEATISLLPAWAQGTWAVRVIADPAPEDAVLEVTEAGKVQRLSLIDGSLVSTEVPHVYGRHHLTGEDWFRTGVRLVGEQAPEARSQKAEDDLGGEDQVFLDQVLAFVTPLSRPLGWAADGEQLLCLEIDALQTHTRRGRIGRITLPVDLSASVLRLADGTERAPVRVEDLRHQDEYSVQGNTVHLWFSIPTDLTSAEAVLRATPFPRRPGLAEELAESCTMTAPITLAPPS